MNRRHFLLGAGALALIGGRRPRAATAFAPTRFSVEVQGRGPDVILIPGLTAGRSIWAATVRAAPGYRYHLIQIAGFAGEPARGNRSGPILSPLAEEIARYIRDRRLRRPAIIGHSMGGTLAMMVGARHPDLAGRIMVVEMLPEPAGLLGQSAAGLGPLANSLISNATGRRALGSLMTAFSPPGSGYRTSDPDVVARAVNELAGIDLTGEIRRIRAAMTVVYASPHRRAGPVLDRSFARAYAGARGARLVRIDDSGHMVMLDQPARFAAAVREFLTLGR